MFEWIIIGLAIYLLIGLGILIYSVKKDAWASLLLELWVLFIMFYPFLFIMNWVLNRKIKRNKQ